MIDIPLRTVVDRRIATAYAITVGQFTSGSEASERLGRAATATRAIDSAGLYRLTAAASILPSETLALRTMRFSNALV
jgi:hypothetical protein